MKKTLSILILCLSIFYFITIFSGCDFCLELSLDSVYLTRISEKYFLDRRVVYKYSEQTKEKECTTRHDKIDTKSIQYLVNKDIVLFKDTILSGNNLWINPKTSKFITFTTNTSLVFDTIFYNNILIDTAGLIITLKAKSIDNVDLVATSAN